MNPGIRGGWPGNRTLADDLADNPKPPDPTPHVHFHTHGKASLHAHEHTHLAGDTHPHSSLTHHPEEDHE